MLVKQISIFIENKTGALSNVCNLLAKNNINMAAVTIADTIDFGIVRTLTDDIDKTVKVLNENGYVNTVNELIAVDVANKPGGLANVLSLLEKENIPVTYIYSFSSDDYRAVILLKVDLVDKTLKVLEKNNIKLVDKKLV